MVNFYQLTECVAALAMEDLDAVFGDGLSDTEYYTAITNAAYWYDRGARGDYMGYMGRSREFPFSEGRE